ncbi:interleukin [Pimephales promelas]|nr:interleukin [Pimephales promelas]
MQALEDLRGALEKMEHLFRNSTATLYTPNTENINECTYKLIDCFVMEMNVLLYEEEPKNELHTLIEQTLKHYECKGKTYYCEQELANSMVFFERMRTFLQKLSAVCQGEQNATCV